MITARYRNMSPAEKLQRVRELTFAVQRLALADIRRPSPTDDARTQQMKLASRWLPADLMAHATRWKSEE